MTSFLKNRTLVSREEAAKQTTRLPDPFVYVIPNGELNRTGEYSVGIMMLNKKSIYASFGYNPSLNYTLRIFESNCKVWDDDVKEWSTKGCRVS